MSRMPYGYKLSPEGIRIENELEQAVINEFRLLRQQGKSYRAIANIFADRGIKNRSGGPWIYGMMHILAKNAPPTKGITFAPNEETKSFLNAMEPQVRTRFINNLVSGWIKEKRTAKSAT